MYNFKDFGIKPTGRFTGKKIEIEEVFNQLITVEAFRIKPSKYPEKGNGLRLELQIRYNGEQRVIFTGSVNLQEMVKQVTEDRMPFQTTIIKESKLFKFT